MKRNEFKSQKSKIFQSDFYLEFLEFLKFFRPFILKFFG